MTPRSLRLAPLLLVPVSFACNAPTPEGERKAPPAAAPSEQAPAAAAAPAPAKPARTPESIAKTVKDAMDPEADACQDFYQYACGGWMENTPLPADKSRYTRSFGVLRDQNLELMHVIMEEAAKNPVGDGEPAKIGRFYAACMDEKAIEAAGTEPLAPVLAKIAAVEDAPGFMRLAGELSTQGVRSLFGVWIGPDDKNPKTNIAHVHQGGLGLPDREYYLDRKKADLLKGYQAHVARMFVLLGEPEAAAAAIAKDVVAFESVLARNHLTRVEQRDPDRTYNKIDRAGIESQVPGLHWAAYAEGTGHPEVDQINVDTVKYLQAAAKFLGKAKKETLQNYLRWKVLHEAADHLPEKFVQEDFEFFGKTLEGQKELEVRWKRCTAATNGAFQHPVGKLYVERAFAGDSKKIALDLILRIEAAFEQALPSLAWMDDTTRTRAMEKVKAIRNKIGYPDKWRDYSGLAIAGERHMDDVLASSKFEYEYQVQKHGKPVDPDEWRSGPPVVNASYSGTRNEMWFPAGILQAPFFDKDHPMAMNFGGIGVVMGHELTHGFDDQGRKFDATGMLREWWEGPVVKEFEKRADCVDKAYSAQEVEPGLFVNGRLTLGENVADMGGVRQAFAAYRAWAAEHGGDATPHVEGLTNDQLLFVSFAQVWCTVATPEYLRVQVATDPHSPGRQRANVPLAMSTDFAAAFQCAPDTPMNPKDRCQVW